MNKKALGKGLGAIFGENGSEPLKVDNINNNANGSLQIEIGKITANPYQPRRVFDEGKLQELAESIKEYGIVQPLVVRRKGKKFELVAGERRFRAAKLAGLSTVPAIVNDYDDAKMMEIALIENIQRHDLNPIEEAEGLRRLMTEFSLTQEQAGEKVGRSRVAVANILRLLNLHKQVQTYLTEGTLNMGQAKMLLSLPKESQQLQVAEEIIKHGWSSRMTEEVVRRLKEGKQLRITREIVEDLMSAGKKRSKQKHDEEHNVFFRDVQNSLVEFLGTKVKIIDKAKGEDGKRSGIIQIEYYSEDDLSRIYELLRSAGSKPAKQKEIKKLSV